MKEILIGQTDYSVFVFIPDPASTDGSGKTGLVAANLTVSYARMETDNDATVTDVTSSLNNLAALTTAHTDWGLIEVSSTLAPGLYRLDIADAVFASGAWTAVVYVMITSSAAAASPIEFELVAVNKLDAVRMGMTALPNAAADAAGGLPISDAGGLDLDARLDAAVSSRQVAIWSSASATVDLSNTTIHNIDGLGDEPFGAQVGENFNLFFNNDNTNTAVVVDDIASAGGLDAAGVRAAVGLASANLDTQLGDIDNFIDTEVSAIKAKTDQLTFTTSNRVDSQVFGMQADTVTASAVADNAIDAGAIATGAITSAKFAAGAITATVIATDAIDADALAADAIAEINATVDTALADYDGPTNAEMVARTIAAADYATAAALDTVDNFLDTEVAAIKAKTDNLPAAPASTGDVTGVWTTAMTESYAADGATITPAQGLYMILQSINEFAISGTTMTIKKLDGSTTAMVTTLNDATNPTSRTRSG